MNEHEAIFRAKEILNQKELFIVLSATQANMIHGVSVPFVGMSERGEKVLYLFNAYDKAKKFIEKQNNCVGGLYPIAKIDKEKKGYRLTDILQIAISLGIKSFDFNLMEDDVFGADITWFLQVNNVVDNEVSILLSKNEMQNPESVGVRFNPMSILNFYDEYEIEDERKNQLLKLIFDAGTTAGDYKRTYSELKTIEIIFILDKLTTRFIPSAAQSGKTGDIAYFRQVELVLQEVLWGKLKTEATLFNAVDSETEKPLIKNGCLYVFITDKYEKMGQYKYEKIKDRNSIFDLIKSTGAENVIITDGPRYIGIIPVDTILKVNLFV